MSLQERTLVVKNFDPERTTSKLLKELFIQGGPVRNIVIKPDHAFVEFEDIESVGYSKALLDGVELFGRSLVMEPKTRSPHYFKFIQILQEYIRFDKQQRQQVQQQQMTTYYQQQAPQLPPHQQPPSMGYPPFEPSPQLPMPNNFANHMDPRICEYNPFVQYKNHNIMPSTSIPRNINNNDNNLRRSMSFNNRHNDRGAGQVRRQDNKGRWNRRR